MHMIASRSPHLSAMTHGADNARGSACICMCACMANLTLRDTF